MIITTGELAHDMINFLNSRGQYQSFLDYMEELGFDINEVEEKLDYIEENN